MEVSSTNALNVIPQNQDSVPGSSTNALIMVTRPLEKVISRPIKILYIKASDTNLRNVIIRPLKKLVLKIIKTLSM